MIKPLYYYVDHTSQFEHNSGIQRCVRSIAKALIHSSVPLIPVVWDREGQKLEAADINALQTLAKCNGPASSSWSSWIDPGLCEGSWILIVELVSGPHNPTYAQLLQAAKHLRFAWVVHDAIPLYWSKLYGARGVDAASHHASYMLSLSSADLILCNSRDTKSKLLSFFSRNLIFRLKNSHLLERVKVLALADEFTESRAERLPIKQDNERLQILCVSTLEPRKNHKNLIKALLWLKATGCQNWQVDFVGWAADPVVLRLIQKACNAGLPLRWHGRADDDKLRFLYNQSDFTVYPSLDEGFGLPVAESLWHHRPCVCSRVGALIERAAFGGCLLVDPDNWKSIASGIELMITNHPLRQKLVDQTQSRPIRYWQNVADELIAYLQNQ